MSRLSSSSDSDSDATRERESRNHKSKNELKLEGEVEKLKKRIENLEWQLERSHKAQRVANWEHHVDNGNLREELEACKKQLALVEKEKTTLAAVCRDNEHLREELASLKVRHREAETEKWAVVKTFSERFQSLESSMYEVTQWMRKELQSQRTPIVAPLVGDSRIESSADVDVQMQSLVMSTNQSERIERELVEEPNGFIPLTSTEEQVQTIPQRVTRSRSLSSRQSRFEAHAEEASSRMESLVTTEGQNELIDEELVQEPIPRRVTRSRSLSSRQSRFEAHAEEASSRMESLVTNEGQNELIDEELVQEPIPRRVTRSQSLSSRQSRFEAHAEEASSRMESLVTNEGQNELIDEELVQEPIPRRVTRSRSARKTLNGPKAEISSPQIESSVTTKSQNEHIEEGLAQELIPRRVNRSRRSNLKRRTIPTMASTSAKVSSKRSRSSLIEMGHDKHAEESEPV
ncbi:unnamed protein product [Orchesella dallaii]|uniref:Uncharacterized protein n=1 Tax=Orchesella dallaii TaxID=48710 RepID=A0ABP1PUR2_9HEXA